MDNKKDNADRGFLSVADAERLTGISQQEVSRWTARLEDVEAYRSRLLGTAYREAMLTPADNHRAEGTGENEWYTPPEYLDAARAVMGGIDLDPATSAHGQKTVQATHHYTRADNGLVQEWHGRVWLNPPYSQPDIGAFITKWGEEIGACRIREAIVLTHNYTDTAWFHLAESSGRVRTRRAKTFLSSSSRPTRQR